MCTSNCPTKDHATWGECVRAKNLRVGYCRSAVNPGYDATAQKKWDRELAYYAAARREGIQPDSTKRAEVEKAFRISDKTGVAYGYGATGRA